MIRCESGLFRLVVLVALAAACAKPDPLEVCAGPCGDGTVLAVSALQFVTAPDENGHVAGFDLDGVDGAPRSDCEADDYTDPAGNKGVDNRLIVMFDVVPNEVREALPLLIRNAIGEGGLSLLFELVRPDGDDGPVHLVVHQGDGAPLVGTDGVILDGQTWRVKRRLGTCRDMQRDGNRLSCGPFDLTVPIEVFGEQYELTLTESRIVLTLGDDGRTAEAVLGGGVPTSDIERIADTISEDDDLGGVIKAVVPGFADLIGGPDDECNRLSASVTVRMRHGYALPPVDEE